MLWYHTYSVVATWAMNRHSVPVSCVFLSDIFSFSMGSSPYYYSLCASALCHVLFLTFQGNWFSFPCTRTYLAFLWKCPGHFFTYDFSPSVLFCFSGSIKARANSHLLPPALNQMLLWSHFLWCWFLSPIYYKALESKSWGIFTFMVSQATLKHICFRR